MKRAVEQLLTRDLKDFPCVAIIGPRQCGKTTLLSTLEGWDRLDLEDPGDAAVLRRDVMGTLRLHPDRLAIDEAQMMPELFSAMRVVIDQKRTQRGRFVLTGSSSPQLIRSISETLAGRVTIIEMAPFTCAEAHAQPIARLYAALRDRIADHDLIKSLSKRYSPKEIHDYWVRGGYPEPWLRHKKDFQSRWADQYQKTYLERDLQRLFPGLNIDRFRTFLQLLSSLSGQIINYSDVARVLGVSAPTARDYFEIAHGTFLWRHIPAYDRNVLKRVVKHPKGYWRDTGLLHHFQRIQDASMLLGHPIVGRSWEGLVVEELLRNFDALGETVHPFHYRTGGGAEVDLILEGPFGLLPIEIKSSSMIDERKLRSLNDFMQEQRCSRGLLITNGDKPRLLSKGIVEIPFAYL